MKYIRKNLEPSSFSEWKAQENDDWKPTWENFQNPEKSDVHKELLKEQGYICNMYSLVHTKNKGIA